ncbi:GNAT family N-acetyltransferase [Clostridium sp. YIM B02515]|uniref:GNAT family N-acetyltransferase n=1 Tax=Clostridium rhizosphaerae TaxID=2803861 RepID=A0ABS1T6I2_9CLOT|nr:GNAT family N-acetyltransferase [Clostridium rhizosphaerae]MBL4934266.1 GNAT family N-acetyltransferase [Clostridium rhizosphaerae]
MLAIKKAKIEDAQLITDIKTKAFNKEINTYLGRDGGPPGYDKVESEINIIKKFIAYKIELDNQIIGALFLIPLNDSKMRFEDFVIEPSFQGKGYGYIVMELVEKIYPHINEWQLSTPVFSVGNQHLYKKFGYIEVARNEDEIEYIKKIK